MPWFGDGYAPALSSAREGGADAASDAEDPRGGRDCARADPEPAPQIGERAGPGHLDPGGAARAGGAAARDHAAGGAGPPRARIHGEPGRPTGTRRQLTPARRAASPRSA